VTTAAAIVIAGGLVLLSACLGIATIVWLRIYRLLTDLGDVEKLLEDTKDYIVDAGSSMKSFKQEISTGLKGHKKLIDVYSADMRELLRDSRKNLAAFTGDIDFARRQLPPNEIEAIESRFEAIEEVMSKMATQFAEVMSSLTPEIDESIIRRGVEIQKRVDAQKRTVEAIPVIEVNLEHAEDDK